MLAQHWATLHIDTVGPALGRQSVLQENHPNPRFCTPIFV